MLWEDIKDFAGFILIILLLCAGVGWVTASVTAHFDSRECAAYPSTMGRETKFVRYNLMSWDCLTPSADGKWISTEALRELTD